MLLLVLALQSATMSPTIQHARPTQRVQHVQRVRISPRARPVATPSRTTPAEASSRYRLTDVTEPREDAKELALRSAGRECGTSGMPVCPSKPRALLRAVLDD